MIIVAKAVTTGHHCGSFQSVQKSQSPANRSLVISAAPPTTKMAVIQKTASQLRSIHRYGRLSRSRSSSRRCRSANDIAVGVVAAMLFHLSASFTFPRFSPFRAAPLSPRHFTFPLCCRRAIQDLPMLSVALSPSRVKESEVCQWIVSSSALYCLLARDILPVSLPAYSNWRRDPPLPHIFPLEGLPYRRHTVHL